jgi:hypothetical protein
MIDYWFHSINIAANFHGARVLLWKDVHRLQSSREPSSDADDPTLEEDFRKAMGDILPEPRPREFTPHLDPLFNLIHAQQAVTYPSNHPAGSSRYYEAMYTGGYSSMETVMSAGAHSAQIYEFNTENTVTLYPLSRPSGCPADCTQLTM